MAKSGLNFPAVTPAEIAESVSPWIARLSRHFILTMRFVKEKHEDLWLAVQHLGYFAVTPEAVCERAREVTEYSAMNLEEFTTFLEKYATQEQADLKEAFQRHAKHSKVSQKSLLILLHETGGLSS
eukprot:s532_g17.t1